MPNCAFCRCVLQEKEGSIVPANAMGHAILHGFSPDMSPSWATMKETAAKAITDYEADFSEVAFLESWKRQLTIPHKRFRLCDACFDSLRSFLPQNPKDLPNLPMGDFGHHPHGEDKTLEWIIPVNTSVWAVLASYAGLFSLIVFPAPIALILGIIALIDIHHHPKKKGKGRAIFAIAMGSIFSMLLALMLVMLLIG